jgi:hypothetical protein
VLLGRRPRLFTKEFIEEPFITQLLLVAENAHKYVTETGLKKSLQFLIRHYLTKLHVE